MKKTVILLALLVLVPILANAGEVIIRDEINFKQEGIPPPVAMNILTMGIMEKLQQNHCQQYKVNVVLLNHLKGITIIEVTGLGCQ